jgi:hypothetical protein
MEGVIDTGEVTIRTPTDTCILPVHSRVFLTECAGQIFYFDGGVLAIVSQKPYALVATKAVRGGPPECGIGKPVDREVTVHGVRVRFRGRREKICID